ncbi:hypothetical protein E2C01_005451 [Portunus trituberculatus]|uniref:Uncharacterized protein n=1 Tax=Portunus trituberculatus TaxID=210409 RepID=A0A5B7CU92_PORTR|nr:hypothetical protein [Portunus trituberculatus]
MDHIAQRSAAKISSKFCSIDMEHGSSSIVTSLSYLTKPERTRLLLMNSECVAQFLVKLDNLALDIPTTCLSLFRLHLFVDWNPLQQ